MKAKIKEVHDYFRDKIVSGDYEVLSIDQYYAHILIDEDYKFNLWIANGESSIGTDRSYTQITFSVKDRQKAWSKISFDVNKWRMEVLEVEERKQYEDLKAKFG